MRTLKFTINQQVLSATDLSGLAVGSENYIQCTFSFDSTWNDAVKVAEFGNESVLIEDDSCTIPETVTRERKFTLRVVGKDGDVKITTNTIMIRQGA